MSSIKEIFDTECADLRIDKQFVNKLTALENGFVNKKPEHIEFFGGALIGVQVVRFTTEDFEVLYNDILNADSETLEDKVHSLPDINTDFVVSSDIFAISCVWIMHAIMNSKYLDDKTKHEGLLRICLYLNYRYLTSILYRFFPYPADPDIAKATYAAMSYRYTLKASGSWHAVFVQRSQDIFAHDSIHYHRILTLSNDYDVVLMLNDIQGRVKDIVKNIVTLFHQVREHGTRISSSSNLIEIDGEIILKDQVRSQANYVRYIKSVIPDKSGFIKQELVDIITKIVHTAPPHMVQTLLEWVSANYSFIKDGSIEKIIDLVMEHAFAYLAENKGLLRNHHDVTDMLVKMRGTYTSSRQSSPQLMEIKELTEDMIKKALNIRGESVLASVRTAFCLFLLIRAFTQQHYKTK